MHVINGHIVLWWKYVLYYVCLQTPVFNFCVKMLRFDREIFCFYVLFLDHMTERDN